MTPLRMTRISCLWMRFGRGVRAGVATLLLVGTAGCGGEPREGDEPEAIPATPVELTNRDRPDLGSKLPPPATDQIEYDKTSRTLTFYELPDSARWVVQVPGAPAAMAAVRHRLPPGVDPDRTLVFYTKPGGQPSSPVSLRQIQQAQGKGHSSQVQ